MSKPESSNSRKQQRFDGLVRAHVPAMFQTAYRLTGNRHDAEDLVQDVLTKLFPQTDTLADVVDLKPWLAKALHNRFIDNVRKQGRRPNAVSGEESLDRIADTRASPDAHVVNDELTRDIHAALDRLTPELRSLVALHLMEGYTLEQLTQVFEVPLGTLKSRLHTARTRLKNMLVPNEPFSPDGRVEEYELPTEQRSDQSLQRAER